MGEVALAALLCSFLSGSDAEERHYFDANGMKRHVRVDCETASHVIEIGLDDTGSARDSLHQALFAAHLTGKTPAVILIDRDGAEGRFEFEMRQVTAMVGVAYARCSADFVIRWAATAGVRMPPASGDDLPASGTARALCDLETIAGPMPGVEVTGVAGVSALLDSQRE